MDLEIGAILTGKVTGITKFGAFVSVAPRKSGLVHISEIANTYVNDVQEHLTVGQEVNVKVIGLDAGTGKINLSIKAALPPAPRETSFRERTPARSAPRAAAPAEPPPSGDVAFEDKLKRFMQDSDNKISGLKQFTDKKNARRRGRERS
ncbi:MAG: S1 RNA-binding domain-containing protein [Oscillospiraceae bacterium]|jgi:S1 RNA binding domain protein|nr:S1 RNA-binding domain-containing protein [Oscillospiraceae bacterium]